MSPNAAGALLMMASMACFTINDTFMKLTDGAIPLFQLLWCAF
jgi:S-adenosylmethionine uptake transporter